ncbi:MAG: nucleotidyltransferase family protein [Oscillospiraceae bacterium]|nr:nucleotidyltransferase family protein [Oscillospiraceae bacterium]
MKTVGIICEYNPLHLGHITHMEKTRAILGDDTAIVCAMSGNYVQRGDFAIFSKYARAKAAVKCGADLVVEIPSPYVLQSAQGYGDAGIYLLDKMGICDYVSFGSESGNIKELTQTAELFESEEFNTFLQKGLGEGLSYAHAYQRAADEIMGSNCMVLQSSNNLLGIEYIKAIKTQGSLMEPMTIKRIRSEELSGNSQEASKIRKQLKNNEEALELLPEAAMEVFKLEMTNTRGPIFMDDFEQAMMSRLRTMDEKEELFADIEGLGRRFIKNAKEEGTIEKILESTKSKRYTMSRIRRLLLCACLGFSPEDTQKPPPYARILAMNSTGKKLLKTAKTNGQLPIITKPAQAKKIGGEPLRLFEKEAAATDFYVLAYPNAQMRSGGQEWRSTPYVIND